MRKITREIIRAFNAGESLRLSNTETDGQSIRLHGNLIAWKNANGLFIDSCGWNTNTTRERLNGLDGVSISTKAGQMYLNGKEWNGEAIEIKD